MASSTTIALVRALESIAANSAIPSKKSLLGVSRSLATASSSAGMQSFKLPDLPYDYGALEPTLSGEIMKLHHSKHHQAYVTNLNASLEKYRAAELSGNVSEMISLQQAIRFNGGGHVNHAIFWQNLAPKSAGGGGEPTGELAAAITSRFGSFAALKQQMSASGASVQGSGWTWLGYNKVTFRLEIAALPNQDPLSTVGLIPLLGIDVWEHAYYLQYKNVRPDYLAAIWNVINWNDVAKRFAAAK
jgi:superoxide dismutase, Fe-Mn family